MEPSVSGPSASFVVSAVVWAEMRHLLELLVWVLVVGFATAAGAWCCGYAVREAWLKDGPPKRRPRHVVTLPDDGPADDVALEASRGIAEIERYLADVRSGRRIPRPDRDADS